MMRERVFICNSKTCQVLECTGDTCALSADSSMDPAKHEPTEVIDE